jgi:hypothetical protein
MPDLHNVIQKHSFVVKKLFVSSHLRTAECQELFCLTISQSVPLVLPSPECAADWQVPGNIIPHGWLLVAQFGRLRFIVGNE